jgi:hypothetical protein
LRATNNPENEKTDVTTIKEEKTEGKVLKA